MSTADNLFPNDTPERRAAEEFVSSNIINFLYANAKLDENGAYTVTNLVELARAIQKMIDQTQSIIAQNFPATELSQVRQNAEIVVMRKLLWLKFGAQDIRHIEEALELSDIAKARTNKALFDGDLNAM